MSCHPERTSGREESAALPAQFDFQLAEQLLSECKNFRKRRLKCCEFLLRVCQITYEWSAQPFKEANQT